jgi:threonine dehydrogenase-like Zn-dependent dehydrogenase
MRAVVYAGPGVVSVNDVPDAGIEEPGDALVQIAVSAICGTDLHAFHGLNGVDPGTVLGHEFVGQVSAVSAGVVSLRVGDWVLGSDFTACGRCWWCQRGDHWECAERRFFGYGTVFGKPLAGAQAEAVRVPHADTVLCRLPPGCPPEAAIFVGDGLATGYAAATRGEVGAGDTVVVVGGGAIGQMTSLASQCLGAATVVVVDPIAARRETAAAHGAVSASPETVSDIVLELTDGRGADVAIDGVGGLKPLQLAFELVRPRGTIVSVGTHFEHEIGISAGRAFADELTLRFAIGNAIRDRQRLLPLVTTGVIDPTVVVTSRIALEGAPNAYQRFARHEELKVLIV